MCSDYICEWMNASIRIGTLSPRRNDFPVLFSPMYTHFSLYTRTHIHTRQHKRCATRMHSCCVWSSSTAVRISAVQNRFAYLHFVYYRFDLNPLNPFASILYNFLITNLIIICLPVHIHTTLPLQNQPTLKGSGDNNED